MPFSPPRYNCQQSIAFRYNSSDGCFWLPVISSRDLSRLVISGSSFRARPGKQSVRLVLLLQSIEFIAISDADAGKPRHVTLTKASVLSTGKPVQVKDGLKE
ncbi:hypothetical protein RRG08_044768 [Elysia crispata]|uniref:Uncharacterized protein n=1 Tax=Elysia crispata TaxID=231223 RepID=A0AAE1DHF0_9GAST|nr:hypothetical protein RRG08_044768 [Elysia crispata]